MLRKLFVFSVVAAVLVAGMIAIPQIAQADCPPGYPVSCGGYCCEAGFVCVGGGCCPPGFSVNCGNYCCQAGQMCVGGGCCPPGYTVGCEGYCCQTGKICAGGGCCPPGYTVNCGDYCCEAGNTCVGGGCCPPGYAVNCGDYCCEAGFVCVDGSCCESGYTVSCEGYCCEAGFVCCEEGDGCCPTSDKTCAECGELLINSVDIGLRSSAMLRTYVWQARQNYANCIREIPGGCENICGKQLYNNLPGCDSDDYNDAGHRACVETSLSGAILECERLQGQ